MSTLTYKPVENTRPFRLGETVLALDRNGDVMEKQVITRIGKVVIKTDCGRSWSLEGEYYANRRAYPFPSITRRHHEQRR